jgi:hypothetical protein
VLADHYTHFGSIDNSVAVEVDNGDDWRLQYVLSTISAGSVGSEEECGTIG